MLPIKTPSNRFFQLSTFGLLILSMQLFAAGLPGMPNYYPDQFDYVGHVQRLDLANRQIVIDDLLVNVPEDTPIYSQQSQTELLSQLYPGIRVGFSASYNSRGTLFMKAAWIIPRTLRVPGKSDEEER